jgi:hypothetical protein
MVEKNGMLLPLYYNIRKKDFNEKKLLIILTIITVISLYVVYLNLPSMNIVRDHEIDKVFIPIVQPSKGTFKGNDHDIDNKNDINKDKDKDKVNIDKKDEPVQFELEPDVQIPDLNIDPMEKDKSINEMRKEKIKNVNISTTQD